MLLHWLVHAALFDYTLAASAVCSSGLYGALQPLAKYVPAQEFCSKKYPVKAVTVVVRAVAKPSPLLSSTSRTPSKSIVSVTTTARSGLVTTTQAGALAAQKVAVPDRNAQLLSTLAVVAGNIAKTFCSCIQRPRTVKISQSMMTSSSAHTTSMPAPISSKPAEPIIPTVEVCQSSQFSPCSNAGFVYNGQYESWTGCCGYLTCYNQNCFFAEDIPQTVPAAVVQRAIGTPVSSPAQVTPANSYEVVHASPSPSNANPEPVSTTTPR